VATVDVVEFAGTEGNTRVANTGQLAVAYTENTELAPVLQPDISFADRRALWPFLFLVLGYYRSDTLKV
jgi:hypothetical protein